jgi:hypothetical protein
VPSTFWSRRLTQALLQLFQEFERFVVASALKVMRESRVDRPRQCLLQSIDLFRNRAQPLRVFFFVATAFFVTNDGEAFSQSFSKIGKRVGFGGLETAAP